MTTAVIQEINRLSAERAALYRTSADGRRGNSGSERIREISGRLEDLWASRRQEKRSERDAIDRVVDHEYERLYGSNYEETVSPAAVEDEEETAGRKAVLAA